MLNKQIHAGLFSNTIIKCEENDDIRASRNIDMENLEHVCLPTPQKRMEMLQSFQFMEIPNLNFTNNANEIQKPHRWIILVGKYRKHKFPLKTILPKVQLSIRVPPRELPRDVEVDRKRREFAKVNLEEELLKEGLTTAHLYPTIEQYYLLSSYAFEHFLPINFFDNDNLDCHSPQSWLELGYTENEIYHIPVKAFLPDGDGLCKCSWQFGAAMSYDESTGLWKVMAIWDEQIYEIPRLQIMFLAENPKTFVKRLKYAVEKRNNAENIMLLNTLLHNLILHDKQQAISRPDEKINKIIDKFKCSSKFREKLRWEAYLLFEHLMAYYAFHKFVKLNPKDYPMFNDISSNDLHPKHQMSISYRDKDYVFLKSLKIDMKGAVFRLLQSTLYYNRAGIEAIANGHNEGTFVERFNLFVTSLTKPLQLPEFLQVQNQNSLHVTNYLKSFWPSKLSSVILLVLRQLGRGWLDITIADWSVYKLCKISQFIFQIKLRMQESMQILLENSINTFINFVTNPCLQFLNLKWDFVWTNDFLTTHFPYEKPIFMLAIHVNQDEKVFYSTKPEEIEPILCDIFKSTLERTNGTRCVDGEMMAGLRFAPNSYVLTVELIEDLYIKKNALLQRCYRQALIPLHAYAKLYERFIPLCMLEVKSFMSKYRETKKATADIKFDIFEHQRQHRELSAILPETITIGPFLINVEPMKLSMIQKLKEIVKNIFEYFIERMLEINENLLARGTEIYNTISNTPISIENLIEIRNYAACLPEKLQTFKDDINVMCMEYELLDSFFYNLSDAQFAMKWDTYAWPHKIVQRLATLYDEQKLDIEEFRRQHSGECALFQERLESLNDEVQGFSLIYDTSKVIETSVEVKKMWNIILELQQTGQTLAFRQKLLELDDFSLEFLDNIIDAFTPYQKLWSSGAEMMKLEEATIGNPMTNLIIDEISKNLEDLRNVLHQLYVVFRESPELQEVAITFLRNVEHFQPVFNCIKYLLTENWLYVHWQELSARSGIEIKTSSNMLFLYLIHKGIMQHYDLVREISTRADLEADEVRKALEEAERQREEEERRILERKQLRKCRRDIL